MMATKKRTAKVKSAAPRGRAPGPFTVTELRDHGDSVFHMSKRVRVLLGTALGGALGSVVGQLFAEDPEKFIDVVTAAISTVKNGGIMASSKPATGGKSWFEKRAAAMWHLAVSDGKAHAFEMAFDGSPGISACGAIEMRVIDVASLFGSDYGRVERCAKCVEVLTAHGYDTKIAGAPTSNEQAAEPVVTPPPADPTVCQFLNVNEKYVATLIASDPSWQEWECVPTDGPGSKWPIYRFEINKNGRWKMRPQDGNMEDPHALATLKSLVAARNAWKPARASN